MASEKWIILNCRLKKVGHKEYDNAKLAQEALDKMFLNNPMGKSQFFVGEKSRYNY